MNWEQILTKVSKDLKPGTNVVVYIKDQPLPKTLLWLASSKDGEIAVRRLEELGFRAKAYNAYNSEIVYAETKDRGIQK